MTPLEEKAIRTIQFMWESCSPEKRQYDESALNCWAENIQGFGSAQHEIWRTKWDFERVLKKVFEENPKGFTVKYKWIEAKQLDTRFVLLWGEVIIIINLPVKTVEIDPLRMTGVLEDNDGELMLLKQWHTSEPDDTTEEEVWAGTAEPKRYDEVTVLFTDFVGFANAVSVIPAKKLVNELNEIFAEFDAIVKKHRLIKIKTIGDSYMLAGGLMNTEEEHAVTAVSAAKEMLQFLEARNEESPLKWDMRVGIHTGPVVGGVLGRENVSFDLWGDTVNLASRMESLSEANKINVSAYAYSLIKQGFSCEYRGKIEVKDRGKVDMYFVL